MELKNYLKDKKQLFDKKIIEILNSISTGVPEILYKAMKYSLEVGGKRLRPILTYATCEALEGDTDDAITVGCAIEFIHTYSLIHDDLPAMDDDNLRRGMPTNHKVFGEAIAILAGDALLSDAFYILSEKKFFKSLNSEKIVKIISFLSKSIGSSGMVGGQVYDLIYEKKPVTEQDVKKIHINKTSKLITAAIYSGAVIAEDEVWKIEKLKIFGEKIGLSFQIIDDILDLISDSKTLGKDAKSDLKKGKATYPKVFGLEKSKEIAINLINEAKKEIEFLKDKGKVLTGIANYFIERVN